MASVFNKKITPACKYCRFSSKLSFGTEILCKKRGFNEPDGYCRSYKYDPLKREPSRIELNNNYKKEDFEI